MIDCKCGHPPHEGRECGCPITQTIRDDVGYGGVMPTFTTRTLIVDSCSCGWDSVLKQEEQP